MCLKPQMINLLLRGYVSEPRQLSEELWRWLNGPQSHRILCSLSISPNPCHHAFNCPQCSRLNLNPPMSTLPGAQIRTTLDFMVPSPWVFSCGLTGSANQLVGLNQSSLTNGTYSGGLDFNSHDMTPSGLGDRAPWKLERVISKNFQENLTYLVTGKKGNR